LDISHTFAALNCTIVAIRLDTWQRHLLTFDSAIFTYGDPNYYSKVGFDHVPQEVAEAPFKLAHPEGWLGQSLDGGSLELPLGQACCVEAFNDPQYW
jgi:hypothetical protein